MSILSIYTDTSGQIGVIPRKVKIICTDTFSTVTTAGYLNSANSESYTIYKTDIIEMWYGAVGNAQSITSAGTYQVFTVSISNGVITLVPEVNYGNVLLPVVSGNLASFNGTTGQISDSGIVASAVATLTATVTLNQAAVLGAYATPVQLIAAPGAGKIIVPIWATVYTNFQTAAFTGGGVAIVQYGNTVHGAGTNALSATIPAAEITAAASQIYSLAGVTASAETGISNAGLFFSNQTGAFTGGNAASTVVVTILYNIITATV